MKYDRHGQVIVRRKKLEVLKESHWKSPDVPGE
jgi:hypothetical protein